ncbi:MAG: Ig-like domain-containing protein [Spirochaetaceae bacterium]|jgi:hypothetical protein|nr:Ig-like domain-containing protein [Spirochaetaceae bacterium]
MYRKFIITLALLAVLFTGCSLEPGSDTQEELNGIVLYSGREILNGKKWEIVTNRVQQLRAVSPSGHQIKWSSNNPSAVEVTQTGLIRSGRTPNKEAIITVTSLQNPSVNAQVTFRTKGLR